MTTTKTKSKKAAPNICLEISNKISTRGAFSVVKTTKQNVLEAFSLPSNRDKLPLVATKATFLSLAGFLPVKVPSKRHTWISPSVVFTPTKTSTSGASSTTSSKKMVKKTKSSEKWEQLLVSAIVTPNPFVVPNKILDEISIVLSGMLFKMGLNQPLAILSNVVSSGRSLLVLEAKQSPSVESPVLVNWTDQIKTELSLFLVSGTTSDDAWKTITSLASTLVSGATFKIKLAHVKALFYVKFAFQTSLDTVFLVELTSSVCLATFKIAKSLVVSKSGFLSAVVALHDVLLGVSAANIKTAFSVFGIVTRVVLKSAGIWQYVVVYFEKLDSAMSALNHWSVLVGRNSVRILLLVNQNKTILFHDRFKAKLVNLSLGCTAFEISNMISQVGGRFCFILRSSDFGHHFCFALIMFGSQADLDLAVANTNMLKNIVFNVKKQAPKMFKPCFVGFLSYAKASALPVMSEFPSLVAFTPFVAVVDPVVGSRLDFLEKQISDLAALVKSIVESVGSLVALVSCFLDDNAVKTV
ncbi:hypothetical protein G9A89_008042 [Geosiphon pyriformis]|nr:hypothetical protein G9A89_008042 [Geosiphon pyriformis]